jgi:diketogulonate reductase-like aldo/keto reductase
MITRRDVLVAAGVSAAAAAFPGVASTPRMMTRNIPVTGEPLGVVGLGNSSAFSDDMATTRELLSRLTEFGGSYVDAQRQARFNILENAPSSDPLFMGTYVNGSDVERDESAIANLRQLRDGAPLDLVYIAIMDDLDERIANLQFWKDQGHCRYIGIAQARTSSYPAIMKLMAAGSIDFVQINYSMLEREVEQRLLPLAADKGVAVVINRPFLNGRYFPLVEGKKLPPWAADFDCNSWAQFALKFIIGHPAVNCVITETSNPLHAVDNFTAGAGRLPDQQTRLKMAALLQSF